MMISLLIGFLLLLGIALIVLDYAIKHAPEGYEDESGFHLETHHWSDKHHTANSGISQWDHAEGASCSVELRPALRPVVNTPFTPHQP